MAELPEMLADLQDDDLLIVFRKRPLRSRQKPMRAQWSVFKEAILAAAPTVQGEPGDKGEPGASAYQVAVALGFSGTASQWLASLKGAPGDVPTIRIGQVKTGSAGSAAKVSNSGTTTAMILDFEIPAGAKGESGASAATPLGTITVAETILVAIGQGVRRVVVTTPTAWGVDVGQNLAAFPVAVPSGQYAIHDVIATGKNTITVGVSVPALAVAATYSISCRLVRLPS